MMSGSSVIRKYIAWYDFKLLCCKKVYCLVWFQNPLSQDSILPGMISESPVLRTYMPGMISGSSVIIMYILEPLNMCPSYGCLGMCFYNPWQNFANMVSPAQMTMPARTVSKFCARTRSGCSDIFFLDLISWRISEIIEPWSECSPEILGICLRSPTNYHDA